MGMSLNDADLHQLGMSLEDNQNESKAPIVATHTTVIDMMTSPSSSAPYVQPTRPQSRNGALTSMNGSRSVKNNNNNNGASSYAFSDVAMNAAAAVAASTSPSDESSMTTIRSSGSSGRRVALDPTLVDNYHARANAYKMVTI
jgi:outer membrane protein W